MTRPRSIHVLDVRVGDHYRNTPDGPVYRAVERAGLRHAAAAAGTVLRFHQVPDYSSRVIPCTQEGMPR